MYRAQQLVSYPDPPTKNRESGGFGNATESSYTHSLWLNRRTIASYVAIVSLYYTESEHIVVRKYITTLGIAIVCFVSQSVSIMIDL